MTNTILKKISIAGATSVIMLVILEIAIRVYGWAPMPEGYSGKKNSPVEGGRIECMNPVVSRMYFNQLVNPYPGCVFYSINNLGFRNGAPTQINKEEGVKRIAAIGDSFTFGFGVLEEDTFLVKMETYFKARGMRAEIINAAEPAAGLADYQKILNDKVSPLSPDVLLVGVNINDVTIFPTNVIIEKVSKKYDYKIRHYSRLLDFICYTFEKNESSKENIKNVLSSYTPERKEKFRNFARFLNVYEKTHKTKVFVMIHPIFFDFKNYAFTDIHNDLDQILKEENISFHDFKDDFVKLNAEDFWMTKNDQHPNEKAHQIYFEGLQKFDLFR